MNQPRTERLLFYGLLITHIIFVVAMPVFLSQDGPSHLNNAQLLLHFWEGSSNDFYNTYLEVNDRFTPNWTGTLILMGLLSIFPPIMAEKVQFILLITGLPLAFRYVLMAINRKSLFLSSLAFLFSYGYFLVYGFYNFQWSLILFLLFVGLYFRYEDHKSFASALGLSLLGILLYFTHPVPLIMALLLPAIRSAASLMTYLKNPDPTQRGPLRRDWAHAGLIALPSMVLMGYFMWNSGGSGNSFFHLNLSFYRIKSLLTMEHLLVFSELERIPFLLFTLGLTILAIRTFKLRTTPDSEGKDRRPLLGLILFSVFVYFFVSDQLAGGMYVTIRITVFIYLVGLLYLAGTSWDHKWRNAGTFLALLLPLSILLIRYPTQRFIGQLAHHCIQVRSHIEEYSTLLPFGFSHNGQFENEIRSPFLQIFKHLGEYPGTDKKVLSLSNYEANTNYFPVIWKPEANPYRHISTTGPDGLESMPPTVDLSRYNAQPCCNIDYVLLWGDRSKFKDNDHMMDLMQQLKTSYTLVHSSDDELIQLYRIK